MIKNHGYPGNPRRYIQIVMTITQTEPTTLIRFQAAVKQGRVHGPYTRGPNKPRWQWTVEGPDRCSEVLDKLWPYLSQPKRDQADGIIDKYVAYRNGLTFKPLRRD